MVCHLLSIIEMFKMFKTQVEPRATGEWLYCKVSWKIAVDLFFTISMTILTSISV